MQKSSEAVVSFSWYRLEKTFLVFFGTFCYFFWPAFLSGQTVFFFKNRQHDVRLLFYDFFYEAFPFFSS